MTTLTLETDPLAIKVEVTQDRLIVELADGRTIAIPLSWYQRLLNGTQAQRKNWRLLGQGYAVEWPDLDEHIGIEGLLAGRRSGESAKSLEQWLIARSNKRS
jgi:hypothetical protein